MIALRNHGEASTRLRGGRIRHGGDASRHASRHEDAQAVLAESDRLLADYDHATHLRASERYATNTLTYVRRWVEALSADTSTAGEDLYASITRFLAEQKAAGGSDKTVVNIRAAISGFLDFAVAAGVIDNNPTPAVTVKTPEKKLPRWLSSSEIEQVLKIADDTGCGNEVRVALSTGMRLAEMQRLKWPDVDFDNRLLYIRKTKNNLPRSVPMCAEANRVFQLQRSEVPADIAYVFPRRQTWPGGSRYVNSQRMDQWWRNAAKPLQEAIPKFTDDQAPRAIGRAWHLFRHTFASTGAQRGVSIYKLAGYLGHTDIKTTQIYAHLAGGYDPDIELACPLTAKRQERKLTPEDIEAAAVGVADLLAIVRRHGLMPEASASTLRAIGLLVQMAGQQDE